MGHIDARKMPFVTGIWMLTKDKISRNNLTTFAFVTPDTKEMDFGAKPMLIIIRV